MSDTKVKLFEESVLTHMPRDGKTPAYWFFSMAMRSRCHPVFNECDDNHEVEDVLRAAGVIRKPNTTDTESSQLWVYFKSKSEGQAFLGRLNNFLVKTLKKINSAYPRPTHA